MPTPNVSVIDFKFVAKKATSKDEINGAIKRVRRAAAQGHPGLHRRAQRLDGFQSRPAFVDVRDGSDQGDGRYVGAGDVLVRQRVGASPTAWRTPPWRWGSFHLTSRRFVVRDGATRWPRSGSLPPFSSWSAWSAPLACFGVCKTRSPDATSQASAASPDRRTLPRPEFNESLDRNDEDANDGGPGASRS